MKGGLYLKTEELSFGKTFASSLLYVNLLEVVEMIAGVHSSGGAISNGRTTQSVWMKGMGCCCAILVGLVTCDEETFAFVLMLVSPHTKNAHDD